MEKKIADSLAATWHVLNTHIYVSTYMCRHRCYFKRNSWVLQKRKKNIIHFVTSI